MRVVEHVIGLPFYATSDFPLQLTRLHLLSITNKLCDRSLLKHANSSALRGAIALVNLATLSQVKPVIAVAEALRLSWLNQKFSELELPTK